MSFSGSWGDISKDDSHAQLSRALELGCTFWDSAVGYGKGGNEELIGEWFKKTGNRDKIFIASKCGIRVSPIIFALATRRGGEEQRGLTKRLSKMERLIIPLNISKSTSKVLSPDLDPPQTFITYTVSTRNMIYPSRSLR
jgi:predicted aldo/keto reductase-like oxidoreductase